MKGLPLEKTAALERLFRSLPDPELLRLNAALGAARKEDPAYGPVADLARAESEEREARDLVLAPLKPLAGPALPGPAKPLLRHQDLALVWSLLRRDAPSAFTRALRLARDPLRRGENEALYDELCLIAARSLLCGTEGSRAPEALARLLQLAPVLRALQPKLAVLIKNLGAEANTALRLAYRDATDVSEDLGPLFMEALFLYLEEPCHILRLISAMVVERASDRYLSASELGSFGERLLWDLEAKVREVAAFDPNRGYEGGAAAGATVRGASLVIREFEDWLVLAKDGPWGSRVHRAQGRLLAAVEQHLREVEGAVKQALPLQAERMAGAVSYRAAPKVEGYPNQVYLRRAEGLLAFMEEIRFVASAAGFGALRARFSEAAVSYIDSYVEDLIERLREGRASEPDWARAYLEAAADLYGLLGGAEQAQIIRRRAAAA